MECIYNDDKWFFELRKHLQEQIQANNLSVYLDHYHTYVKACICRLFSKYNVEFDIENSINSLLGRYEKYLWENGIITSDSTRKILGNSRKLLEKFNEIRNNETLAHVNKLVSPNESVFIFRQLDNLLQFIDAQEDSNFSLSGDTFIGRYNKSVFEFQIGIPEFSHNGARLCVYFDIFNKSSVCIEECYLTLRIEDISPDMKIFWSEENSESRGVPIENPISIPAKTSKRCNVAIVWQNDANAVLLVPIEELKQLFQGEKVIVISAHGKWNDSEINQSQTFKLIYEGGTNLRLEPASML